MAEVRLRHMKGINKPKYDKGTELYKADSPGEVNQNNYIGGDEKYSLTGKMPKLQTITPPPHEFSEARFNPTYPNNNGQSSTTVRKGDRVNIGDRVVTITDPYGIRNFKGREGKHSTGIDIVTSDKSAIALTDMEIVDVLLDGDGSVMTPSEGSAGGYYIITKNSDGTMSQYMHLDPMTGVEMERLKGKKFKRGDKFWDYGIGSGSMTGPHIKYRVSDGFPGSKSHKDPTSYFLGI